MGSDEKATKIVTSEVLEEIKNIYNKNIEQCIESYEKQIKHDDNFKGHTILNMLRDLERNLKL